MLRGQSCFQLSAVEPITLSQPNHARKECIQVHYIAFNFTGEFSFSTLKCHLSFGFTVPSEKHSSTLENHNGGTLPRPGIDVCNTLQCGHCCCGTRGTWCSVKDQLNDAGTQVLCRWRTLKMLFSCAASQYKGLCTSVRCMCPLDMLWFHDHILWQWVVTTVQPTSCE